MSTKSVPKISSKRRLANQRNAMRSTGPRTQQGKHVVALNAISHGLSVPLNPIVLETLHPHLLGSLRREGIDLRTAEQLALKILDYERNQEFALNSYADQMGVQLPDPDLSMRDEVVQELLCMSRSSPDEFAREAKKLGRPARFLSVLLQELQQEYRQERRALSVLARRTAGGKRFMKRSSNQLIRALKALT